MRMQKNNLYSYIIFIFLYKKFTAAVKFQYLKDNFILQIAKGCRQDVVLSSRSYKPKRKVFAFPWPHENVSPHYWLITPRNPSFSQSICSLWLRDQSSTLKAQKKCWQYINLSISRDPTTTINQCFPYLSRAITPVIVQNANSPMLFR